MTMAVHRAHREGVPLNNQFPDLISSHKLNTHSLLEAPLHYSSFLYLSLVRGIRVWTDKLSENPDLIPTSLTLVGQNRTVIRTSRSGPPATVGAI